MDLPRAPRVASEHEVRLSVDYGTTQLKVAYHVAAKGKPTSTRQTFVASLQAQYGQLPQVLGFVKQREAPSDAPETRASFAFFWGAEFEEQLDRTDLGADDVFVFNNLKICLYSSRFQIQHRENIERELERYALASDEPDTSLEWLLALHLSKVRQRAIQSIQAEFDWLWPVEEFSAVHQQWVFSVPEVATSASNQMFARAIMRAGYPEGIMLVTETEAASAWLMHEYDLARGWSPERLGVSRSPLVTTHRVLTQCH